MRKEHEGIAVELPIVQKLRTVDASEMGNAKQALRHLELDTLGVPEQYHRRASQNSFSKKPQAA